MFTALVGLGLKISTCQEIPSDVSTLLVCMLAMVAEVLITAVCEEVGLKLSSPFLIPGELPWHCTMPSD